MRAIGPSSFALGPAFKRKQIHASSCSLNGEAGSRRRAAIKADHCSRLAAAKGACTLSTATHLGKRSIDVERNVHGELCRRSCKQWRWSVRLPACLLFPSWLCSSTSYGRKTPFLNPQIDLALRRRQRRRRRREAPAATAMPPPSVASRWFRLAGRYVFAESSLSLSIPLSLRPILSPWQDAGGRTHTRADGRASERARALRNRYMLAMP